LGWLGLLTGVKANAVRSLWHPNLLELRCAVTMSFKPKDFPNSVTTRDRDNDKRSYTSRSAPTLYEVSSEDPKTINVPFSVAAS
jgi:hypothetical protein